MKIAFVNQPWNWVPPVRFGSIAIWIYEVVRRLAWDCDVVVYAREGRFQKKAEYTEGVHFRRFSVRSDERVLILLENFWRFSDPKRPGFASPLYYLGYILKVANELRKQHCDVVHIHNLSQFVPIIRAFNPEIKIVLHMHCEWLTQLDQEMVERRLRKVDLITGCSEYITEKIRRAFPKFAGRCQTVFNGVDVDHFAGDKSDNKDTHDGVKRLLFVGRLSPEKGLHVLINAFHTVTECYPEAQLEIIGPESPTPREFIANLSDSKQVSALASFYDGSYRNHLLKQVFSLNMTEQVTFSGFVNHEHLVTRYRGADVLVNPSLSESFGMSLIEAMACEVPVVATHVGGMTEIVENEKTGVLVEADDAPALADAILRLLKDDLLKKSMGKAARRRAVKLFSWDQVARNLLYQYRNLCESNA